MGYWGGDARGEWRRSSLVDVGERTGRKAEKREREVYDLHTHKSLYHHYY